MPEDTTPAFEAGVDLIKNLLHAVNVMGSEKEVISGIITALNCEHRTLQASMIRVILKSLVGWAKNADINQSFDLRNEAAVKTVMKIAPIVQDNPIPFI